MYKANAIANYFINLARKNGVTDLSPMKLQKLVYYAHGWTLGTLNKPLINEQIEAWKFGPVVPTIFHAAKEHGNNNINKPLLEFDFDADSLEFTPCKPTVDANNKEIIELLDVIWEVYGRLPAYQLSNMTHLSGTPWDTINKKYNGEIPNNTDINTEIIKDWFEKEAERISSESN